MYKDSQDLQSPTPSSTEGISKLKLMEGLRFSQGTPERETTNRKGFNSSPIKTIFSWDTLFFAPTHNAKSRGTLQRNPGSGWLSLFTH